MPKLTIDGREVEVPQGTTVLQAALSLGREIPHYCYHPGLSIAGNCRMCLVEVEKAPKLLIACSTQAADGMVVHTGSEKVKAAREAMMEFFLINHPLDCPICDQAGECRLQEYAVEYGHGESRYTEPKLASSKAVDIGRHVMLDQERCIQCSRCIRFCSEVTKTGELDFFRRGQKTVIGIFPGRRLDNAYSGNVVDICPVGALTLKEFRFETRVWYLRNTPSVCAGCSRGCNVIVGTGTMRERMAVPGNQDAGVKRVVARENDAVNGHWICDEGRLSYRGLHRAPRIEAAESSAEPQADWSAVVATAAEWLAEAARRGRAGAILSPRLTNEDLFAWRKLFEGLGGLKAGAVRRLVRGEDDGLLVRADKGANARGASWILGAGADEAAMLDAARRGEIDTLLVAGDPLDPDDTASLPDEVRAAVKHVLFVGPFRSGAAERADLRLPSSAWSEEDGTIVNFEGRIQRVRRCRLPEGEGRPGWRVALDVAEVARVAMPGWTEPADVYASIVAEVAAFGGTDWGRVGLLGIPGTQTAAAGA